MPQKPQAVIVAPTRELAIQIKDEARKFSNGSMVKAVVAYGGTSTGYQLSQLSRGTNLLICTPGRLMGFVEMGKVSFEQCKFLVLDEADRMLDMGFHPEVQKIVGHSTMTAKDERQTLMFSATFPSAVQHLALGKSLILICNKLNYSLLFHSCRISEGLLIFDHRYRWRREQRCRPKVLSSGKIQKT